MPIISENEIMELVRQDPLRVLILKPDYLSTNIWAVAIQLEPSLFQFIENPSEDICLIALEEDGNNLQYIINKKIRLTKKMVMTAITNYPGAVKYLDKLHLTDEVKEYACDLDPTLIKSFSYIRPEYIEMILIKDATKARYIPNPSERQIINALKEDINYCAFVEEFTPTIKAMIKEYYPNIAHLLPQLKEGESNG